MCRLCLCCAAYVCSMLLMSCVDYVCAVLPMSVECCLCSVSTMSVAWCLCPVVAAYVCGVSPMSVACRPCLWCVAYVCGCRLCVAAFTYIGLHVCLVVKNMFDSSWSVGPSGRIFSLSSSNRFTFSGDSPCKHNNL